MSLSILEQAVAIREAMDKAGAMLSTEQAKSVTYLYKPLETNDDDNKHHKFNVGERRRHNGVLYECKQEHERKKNQKLNEQLSFWDCFNNKCEDKK